MSCCACIPDEPIDDPTGRIKTRRTGRYFCTNMVSGGSVISSPSAAFFWKKLMFLWFLSHRKFVYLQMDAPCAGGWSTFSWFCFQAMPCTCGLTQVRAFRIRIFLVVTFVLLCLPSTFFASVFWTAI
jgi:hypothetical protein